MVYGGEIYIKQNGMVWYSMVWYGMVQYGTSMVWYGMVKAFRPETHMRITLQLLLRLVGSLLSGHGVKCIIICAYHGHAVLGMIGSDVALLTKAQDGKWAVQDSFTVAQASPSKDAGAQVRATRYIRYHRDLVSLSLIQ